MRCIADIIKLDDKEWGGKGVKYFDIPESMKLTLAERRADSARLRARYTANEVKRGSVGCIR